MCEIRIPNTTYTRSRWRRVGNLRIKHLLSLIIMKICFAKTTDFVGNSLFGFSEAGSISVCDKKLLRWHGYSFAQFALKNGAFGIKLDSQNIFCKYFTTLKWSQCFTFLTRNICGSYNCSSDRFSCVHSSFAMIKQVVLCINAPYPQPKKSASLKQNCRIPYPILLSTPSQYIWLTYGEEVQCRRTKFSLTSNNIFKRISATLENYTFADIITTSMLF